MAWEYARLFFTFLLIGALGFGGGYAMLSMVMTEAVKFSVTSAQLGDLAALDMVVPGPIAINAATYVGYLHGGFWGAFFATLGVMFPSFIIIAFVMYCLERFRKNKIMEGFLAGVRPAAVGLIAAAAAVIAAAVVLREGAGWLGLFFDPLGTVSVAAAILFVAAAVGNIRWKVNPILLTLGAGVIGAFLWKVI